MILKRLRIDHPRNLPGRPVVTLGVEDQATLRQLRLDIWPEEWENAADPEAMIEEYYEELEERFKSLVAEMN